MPAPKSGRGDNRGRSREVWDNPTDPSVPARELTGDSTVMEAFAGLHQLARNINSGILTAGRLSRGTAMEGTIGRGIKWYDDWWDAQRGMLPSYAELRAQAMGNSRLHIPFFNEAARASYRRIRTGTTRASMNEVLRVDRGSIYRQIQRVAPTVYMWHTGQESIGRYNENPVKPHLTPYPNPKWPLSRAIPHMIPKELKLTNEEKGHYTEFGVSVYGLVRELTSPGDDGTNYASTMLLIAQGTEDIDKIDKEAFAEYLGGAPVFPKGGTMQEDDQKNWDPPAPLETLK